MSTTEQVLDTTAHLGAVPARFGKLLNAEGHHLVQPRHNHPGPISAEPQDLRRADAAANAASASPLIA